jgi:tartrate dehydratase beta subunit/fumarate hydratase class I family protein
VKGGVVDLQPNDTVEVTQADKKHECVYVGQRGRIISVQHGQVSLHLRCGHVWDVPMTHVRKLEVEEAVAPAVAVVDEDEDDWNHDVSDE